MSHSYIITDVGSTTTKAILIGEKNAEFRLLGRGEAPTTVELPYEDVTYGVINAIRGLEDSTGRKLLCEEPGTGCPLKHPGSEVRYLSTSSAGGGLQVLVFGVVKGVSAESASRAALGAGAILLDVMAVDDGRPTFARVDAIRNARPDIVLIAGGYDGGNTAFALEICDLLNLARPKPRFGKGFTIPVVYAGNKDAAPLVRDTLSEGFDLKIVENLRPTLEREVLEPARTAIHELFMSHVMAHAPGYEKLKSWVDADILPTPAAVGRMMEVLAYRHRANLLGVDIGGATTDVFSVIDGSFHRSVSANLGMSYSAGNVLIEAGVENVLRWLPFEVPWHQVADRVFTKLINPTTVPRTFMDLQIEQALATEALRLAFVQHKEIASSLPVQMSPLMAMLTGQDEQVRARTRRTSLVDISDVDMIVGSGGVVSHAPKRAQAALMLINAFQPVGVTHLAVDSIFMMPNLGVLSQLEPEMALDVLERDCFVRLGPVVAPEGEVTPGEPALAVTIRHHSGGQEAIVNGGDIHVFPLRAGDEVEIEVEALGGLSIGGGSRAKFKTSGGVLGLIADCRGRPLKFPKDPGERAALVSKWQHQIGAYGEGCR